MQQHHENPISQSRTGTANANIIALTFKENAWFYTALFWSEAPVNAINVM